MKILTVIVPTYNKENLLRQCLNSFAKEEFRETLEVIAVDDGSTDRSFEIIREYAGQFPDIFVPIHKENGGVSSVMNMGLENATGKYVKEVDADDWVDTLALKKLIAYLKNSHADIVLNSYREVDEAGNKIEDWYLKGVYYQREYQVESILRGMFENIVRDMRVGVQSITVRKQLLEDVQFHFADSRYYVDMQLVESCILHASTCAFLGNSLYRYRKNQAEQSVSIESYVKHRGDFETQTMLSLQRISECEQEMKRWYLKAAAQRYCSILYALYLLDSKTSAKDKWKQLDEYLSREWQEIYDALNQTPFIGRVRKHQYRLFGIQKRTFQYKAQKLLKGREREIGIDELCEL